MGEGWGDFFAICMTSQATDDFAKGVFAVGGWTDLTPSFKDNYYFSIRRYPYSADMTKNPLTFKHIGANVMLPAGPPRNPNAGGPNNEVHNAGEVWCCALWEVFVNLVATHGHADGREAHAAIRRRRAEADAVAPDVPAGARRHPLGRHRADPADVPLVWQGFAKRGMGKDARGPASSSSTLTGVVESFDIPAPALSETAAAA